MNANIYGGHPRILLMWSLQSGPKVKKYSNDNISTSLVKTSFKDWEERYYILL
jgi:hypothetical protein